MENINYVSDRFASAQDQAIEVGQWGDRYNRLVNTLRRLGTEVMVARVLETDVDSPPCYYIRNGFHEFVFPPQSEAVVTDNSHHIDPTPGYSLFKEDISRTFDPSRVRGHLSLFYQDSDGRIQFRITDKLGESKLTKRVTAALTGVSDAIPRPERVKIASKQSRKVNA